MLFSGPYTKIGPNIISVKRSRRSVFSMKTAATIVPLCFLLDLSLFPTMPRHNYYKIAPLVKSLCAKYGVPYEEKPLMRAFADIVG